MFLDEWKLSAGRAPFLSKLSVGLSVCQARHIYTIDVKECGV
jgi:hypothetical protein